MTALKKVNGFMFPGEDREGAEAMFLTLPDLEAYYPFCQKFDVAVQAGGNVGVWPKKIAEKFKAVYTFEPDHENFGCMNFNLMDAPNVIKMQEALGSHPGTVGLHRVPQNAGAHYVEGPGIIPTLRIDDLGLSGLDFLMLDVEGYELAAILGAEKAIRAFQPAIVTEDKHYRAGSQRGDVEAFLARIGYAKIAQKHRDAVFAPIGRQANSVVNIA